MGMKFSRADILAHFPSPKSPQTKDKGGAPKKYDWESALIHLIAKANHPDGLHPQCKLSAAYIGELLADWFAANSPDGEHPGKTSRHAISHRILQEISAFNSKAG